MEWNLIHNEHKAKVKRQMNDTYFNIHLEKTKQRKALGCVPRCLKTFTLRIKEVNWIR